jgi:alpha-D-ribose 1-methylphosphonate 5-triphosphate synthase subunit PhnH
LTTRNARVSEFPLGIDLAFFDQLGRVVALPRTTRAVRGET